MTLQQQGNVFYFLTVFALFFLFVPRNADIGDWKYITVRAGLFALVLFVMTSNEALIEGASVVDCKCLKQHFVPVQSASATNTPAPKASAPA